jgi:hypothetical protein
LHIFTWGEYKRGIADVDVVDTTIGVTMQK